MGMKHSTASLEPNPHSSHTDWTVLSATLQVLYGRYMFSQDGTRVPSLPVPAFTDSKLLWCRHHNVDVCIWAVLSSVIFLSSWFLTYNGLQFLGCILSAQVVSLVVWHNLECNVPRAMSLHLRSHRPLSMLDSENQYVDLVHYVNGLEDRYLTTYHTVVQTRVTVFSDCVAFILMMIQDSILRAMTQAREFCFACVRCVAKFGLWIFGGIVRMWPVICLISLFISSILLIIVFHNNVNVDTFHFAPRLMCQSAPSRVVRPLRAPLRTAPMLHSSNIDHFPVSATACVTGLAWEPVAFHDTVSVSNDNSTTTTLYDCVFVYPAMGGNRGTATGPISAR